VLIENSFAVRAPSERVFAHLVDLPGLVPCLPGAALVGENADGSYDGTVLTRLGPVSLRFSGTARLVESDEGAGRMRIDASGAEDKGKGTAEMTITARVEATGASASTVHVTQDLQVSGAAAQYGRGMITDVSGVLLRSFAECLAATIEGAGSGGTATATRTAAPAGGFAIGLAAALMALRRVARRFFGPSTRPSQ
jgi:carbon monoxide dehydrogenase subunit G